MSALFLALERASLFGMAALVVALVAQHVLDGRVPASWRVWVWRVASLQTALVLVPLSPLRLAVLPPRPMVAEPIRPMDDATPSPFSSPNEKAEAMSTGIAAAEAAPSAPSISVPQTARTLSPEMLVVALYGLGLGVQMLLLARCFGQ